MNALQGAATSGTHTKTEWMLTAQRQREEAAAAAALARSTAILRHMVRPRRQASQAPCRCADHHGKHALVAAVPGCVHWQAMQAARRLVCSTCHLCEPNLPTPPLRLHTHAFPPKILPAAPPIPCLAPMPRTTQEELAAEEERQRREAAAAAAEAAAAARSPLRLLAEWGWQLLQRLCLAALAGILAAAKAVQGGLARLEADLAAADAAEVATAISASVDDESMLADADCNAGEPAGVVFAGASAAEQAGP